MPKVYLLEDSPEELSYGFYCAGCKCGHFFRIRTGIFTRNDPGRPMTPLWNWNGDFDKPTVEPSLHVFPKNPEKTCHSFITDGKIRYLSDSYHHLKGQTVEMEDDD